MLQVYKILLYNFKLFGVKVCTDLEKSLNLTLVRENSWNLKKVTCHGIVLEFCKVILENYE